jgi:hypothetical protein
MRRSLNRESVERGQQATARDKGREEQLPSL